MKKVLNIIFSIILVTTCLVYGTVYVATKTFNTETTNVEEKKNEGIGATYNIKGDRKLVSYAEIYDIDKVDSKIAHRYLDADLKKYDIPIEALDYVLAEDDYQGMYYDYRTKAIGYLKDENEKPTLDINRILTMTEKGLMRYNSENEKQLNIQKIKTNVEEVAHTIDTKIEQLKNNKLISKTFAFITNDAVKVGSLVLGIISIIVIMIINVLSKEFRILGVDFLVSGVLISLGWLLSKLFALSLLPSVLGPIINYIQSKAFALGLLYLAIGITLILIGTAIGNAKKEAPRKKDLYKNKEKPEEPKEDEVKEEKQEEPKEDKKEEKKEPPKKNSGTKNKSTKKK